MATKIKEAKKTQYFAKLKGCPSSPRKMRYVVDMVRGMEVNRALGILRFSNKAAAADVEKLLRSAIANWEAKNERKAEDGELFITRVFVDEGVTLKRMRPAPQGRGYRIRKRSNHVTLFVDAKTNDVKDPISNRLGIVRGWDSNWFGGKDFGDNLVEDQKIRKYLNERLAKASVSKIVIERTLKLVTITICTARPGIVIGKGGQDVDKLKEELKKLYNKEIQINIYEVKRPELDANIVANNIARQVEGKIAYRRAIKMAIQNTMRAGAEGIKVLISGRLNGAEIARSEMLKEGRTPLHTFRADIDYCHTEALTKVGLLGIKVWICRGEIYGKVDLAPNFTQEKGMGRGNAAPGRDRDRKFRNKKSNNR